MTQPNTRNIRTLSLILAAALWLAATGPGSATQVSAQQTRGDGLNPAVSHADLGVPRVADLSNASFPVETLTRSQWREIGKQMRSHLRSADLAAREEGLRTAIHLATFFPEQVNCRRAVPELIDIYLFDRNDALRTMAVAALHAIGNREAVAIMAERVRYERSPLVKHVTMHTVASYLAREGQL
jgi:hypothetical protein